MADRFPLIANSSANQIQELAAADQLNLTGSNLIFGDSSDGSSDDVLSFGASGDLKIFHQADQSRIVESGPSVLKIMGSDVRISNAGNTADYFQGNDGSDVKQFHNGNLKLATTSGGIDVTGGITVNGSALSSGGVIQTKSTTRTNQIDVSVNIDVDYGSFGDIVAVTITPTSSSNKIMIMYTVSGSGDQGNHGVTTIKRAISGGSTSYPALGDSASGFHRASTGTRFIGGNNYNIATQSFSFLDSPSTTSAITYTVVGATEGADTWHINSNGENHSGAGWSTRFCTSITVMEVKP